MLKFRYSLLFFALGTLGTFAQGQRATLWLRGIITTSNNFTNTQTGVSNAGYQFDAINEFAYNSVAEGIAGSATRFSNQLDQEDRQNVLAIGHDFGGLVLRRLAAQNSRVTGVILLGVPNRGSVALERILPPTFGGAPEIDGYIKAIGAFRSAANDCEDCDILTAFESFVDEIQGLETAYRALLPNSPEIESLPAPTVPTAVIRGSEEAPFQLTRLLSSRAFRPAGAGDEAYLDCYQPRIDRRRREIADAYIDGLVSNSLNLYDNITRLVSVPAGGRPTDSVSSIAGILRRLNDNVVAARERDQALADLLECELVHQGLNAYWNVIVNQNFYETETITYSYYVDELGECLDQCAADYYDGPIPIYDNWISCRDACDYLYDGEPVLVSGSYEVSVYAGHDGLYNLTEQNLTGDGVVGPYEAAGSNHFQELNWVIDGQQPNTPLREAYQDLFDGNAGPAFALPN